MKCNRKTLMHINKFVKTTIITYYKNNSILTSKYTQESFQVSLNINFVKCMFMWMSSMTSSIYRLIVPLAHKNILQYKRKNMRRNWARNLMLVQMFILIFLIFSYYYYYYYHHLFFIISRLHTNISSLFFCKHVHTINLFLIHYYIYLCISIQVIHARMKLLSFFFPQIYSLKTSKCAN